MPDNQVFEEGDIPLGLSSHETGLYLEGQLAKRRLNRFGLLMVLIIFVIIVAILAYITQGGTITETSPDVILNEVMFFVDG